MTTETYDLEDFIPHRGAMRLVDRLGQVDDDQAEVFSRVRADWPLVEDGQADPLVLIEVVAQAAASLAGYRKRNEERLGGRGWLVGVRRTELSTADLPVGTELTVHIRVDYQLKDYAVFQGQVQAEGRKLAEVEVQTFKPDDTFWEERECHGD